MKFSHSRNHSINTSNLIVQELLRDYEKEIFQKEMKKQILMNFLPTSIDGIIRTSHLKCDSENIHLHLKKQDIKEEHDFRKSQFNEPNFLKRNLQKEKPIHIEQQKGKQMHKLRFTQTPDHQSRKTTKYIQSENKITSKSRIRSTKNLEPKSNLIKIVLQSIDDENIEFQQARKAFLKKRKMQNSIQKSFNLFEKTKNVITKVDTIITNPRFTTSYDGEIIYFGQDHNLTTEQKNKKNINYQKKVKGKKPEENSTILRQTGKAFAQCNLKQLEKKEEKQIAYLQFDFTHRFREPRFKQTKKLRVGVRSLNDSTRQMFQQHINALRLSKGVNFNFKNDENSRISMLSKRKISSIKSTRRKGMTKANFKLQGLNFQGINW